MLVAIEQAVQHCDLTMDEQAVQPCRFETLSLESCQPALEFFPVRGRQPV